MLENPLAASVFEIWYSDCIAGVYALGGGISSGAHYRWYHWYVLIANRCFLDRA